jgi:S-adenosylmethionine decarboxylase
MNDTDIIGTHMLITLKNTPNSSVLERIENVKPLLDTIVEKCDLHVVSETGYQFEPFGATYVYVLSESHMSIHTYPEKNSAYMDIFCCNPDFDCAAAADAIRNAFQTQDVDYKVFYR